MTVEYRVSQGSCYSKEELFLNTIEGTHASLSSEFLKHLTTTFSTNIHHKTLAGMLTLGTTPHNNLYEKLFGNNTLSEEILQVSRGAFLSLETL